MSVTAPVTATDNVFDIGTTLKSPRMIYTHDLTVAGQITAAVFDVGILNTATVNVTNSVTAGTFLSGTSVIYRSAADGPSAATIGAGNAAIWASNSVPAILYIRTSDGASVVDTLFP